MSETLRLGRIAGVRVGANWSVLVIFLLIAVGLAAGRFPQRFPDASTGAYAAAGLIAAVVFLASLLAHEVSHAVVARRNGVGVEGITLWMFGGVANLRGEAGDPGADLRIAGVGPLVSVVLGVAFFALALALTALGTTGLVVGVLTWLGVINIALAVFNLVPAAPLDGGRILRGALWRWHGDRLRAAVTATRAGQVFGFVLVGLGLLQIVAVPGFAGLWLMLIGWFIVAAAGAERRQTTVRARLADVPARDVMSTEPIAAPGSLSLDEFVDEYVFHHNFSSFPLLQDGDRPFGLVTLDRVRGVPRDAWASTRVGDVACSGEDLATAGPDEPLADILERMSGCADGRVLVVDDGRLVGMITPADVTNRLEIAQLRSEEPQHL